VFAEGVVLPEVGDLLLRHQARTDDPKQPAANTKPEDIFVSLSHG